MLERTLSCTIIYYKLLKCNNFCNFSLTIRPIFEKLSKATKAQNPSFIFCAKYKGDFYLQGASVLCILLKTKFARITEQTPAVSLPMITGTR